MVDQKSAGWNRIADWLKIVDAVRATWGSVFRRRVHRRQILKKPISRARRISFARDHNSRPELAALFLWIA